MKKISIAYGGKSEERGFVASYKLMLTVDSFIFKKKKIHPWSLFIAALTERRIPAF